MSKKNLNQYMERFEYLMHLFHKNIADVDEGCVEKMDLTPHQFIVLKIIANTNNCIMSDLSKSLGVTMGNMTSMVDRLIREGYVTRDHDPADRRVVKVKLTDKGREIAVKASKRKQAMLLNIFKKLSKKDILTILGLFEKIVTS